MPEFLFIKESSINRLGCFTSKFISKDHCIAEYEGEIISAEEAIKREEDLNRSGIYTFWLNDDHAIDGYDKGNHTKYFNHSCDPSCHYEIAGNKILFYASRDIQNNEELTIDYDYDANSGLVVCLCGSANCRGYLNEVVENV
ncbi:MAG TPA: SET domain-containing protein-lysine N-methyltransferase [Bacteroidetes bacterium]|nr:SET domain-containing protein-lysine N-methyltransferase [Bacteroidota bacterium]